MWQATALGAIAAMLVWVGTQRPGPSFGYDAVAYMGAAEQITTGHGFVVPFSMQLRSDASGARAARDSTAPLVHWPPGYPLTLALVRTSGMSTVDAARAVNAAAAGVTVGVAACLVGWAVVMVSALLLALALCITPQFVDHSLEILSEPLFTALLVVFVALLARRPAKPVVYGAVAAYATFVRYLGVALVGAAALYAIAQPGTWRRRGWRGLLAVGPAIVLQLLWMLARPGQGSQARAYRLYPGIGGALYRAVASYARLVVPASVVRSPIAALGVLLLAAGAVAVVVVSAVRGALRAASSPERADARRLLNLLAAVAAATGALWGVLLAARLVADPALNFDQRILFPVMVLAEIGVVASVAWWVRGARQRGRVAVGAAFALWVMMSVYDTTSNLRAERRDPLGLAALHWQRSPIFEAVRTVAAGMPLYSDGTELLYWYGGRSGRLIPALGDSLGVAAVMAQLRAEGGVLVWCEPDSTVEGHWLGALRRLSPSTRVTRVGDGLIVDVPAPAVVGAVAVQ